MCIDLSIAYQICTRRLCNYDYLFLLFRKLYYFLSFLFFPPFFLTGFMFPPDVCQKNSCSCKDTSLLLSSRIFFLPVLLCFCVCSFLTGLKLPGEVGETTICPWQDRLKLFRIDDAPIWWFILLRMSFFYMIMLFSGGQSEIHFMLTCAYGRYIFHYEYFKMVYRFQCLITLTNVSVLLNMHTSVVGVQKKHVSCMIILFFGGRCEIRFMLTYARGRYIFITSTLNWSTAFSALTTLSFFLFLWTCIPLSSVYQKEKKPLERQ